MSAAEREALKLKRISDIEMVYTVLMVVGILACVAAIDTLGPWTMALAVALFIPKFYIAARWQMQLERVAEVSPGAKRLAQARGYLND